MTVRDPDEAMKKNPACLNKSITTTFWKDTRISAIIKGQASGSAKNLMIVYDLDLQKFRVDGTLSVWRIVSTGNTMLLDREK